MDDSTDRPVTPATSSRSRPLRQDTVRRNNLGLVLDHVLRASSPPSRAELATTTGLTRATVSTLVDRLVRAGLVEELEPATPQRAGRPAVPLSAARGTVAAIGVEVNVDYVRSVALDLSDTVVAEVVERDDFRGSDPARVLQRAARQAAGMVTDARGRGIRLAGLTVAVPGLVQHGTARLRLAPNLGWRDVDVAAAFTAPVFDGLAVGIGNEANLAARAEVHARRDEQPPWFVYVSGEIGIGGALVHGGEVFLGPGGGAGELGHVTVDPAGPACTCGARGCLERFAGKDALLRHAGLPTGTPLAALVARAADGDDAARGALDGAGRALGVALSAVVNLVAIDRVVLGGIYVALAAWLRPAMEREFRQRVLLHPWSPVGVEVAQAGEMPAATGAALAVLEQVLLDPVGWGAA